CIRGAVLAEDDIPLQFTTDDNKGKMKGKTNGGDYFGRVPRSGPRWDDFLGCGFACGGRLPRFCARVGARVCARVGARPGLSLSVAPISSSCPFTRPRKTSLIGTSSYGSSSRKRLIMNRWYDSFTILGSLTKSTIVGGA